MSWTRSRPIAGPDQPRALANDPLNAHALRILGQLADDGSTVKLMQAAARRSIREGIAVYWLMLDSGKNRDNASAVRYADVLLRTRSGVVPLVLPTLANAAEGKANETLKTLLASGPPWRSRVLAALPEAVSDPRTPLELMLALRKTPAPPTTTELRRYIGFLISRKRYELAYYTWLQFLPRAQLRNAGFLFNGGFDLPPSGLPFDWLFRAGSGTTIDIAGLPGRTDQRALLIEFGEGRVDFGGVTQLLMLPVGEYHLTGKYRGTIKGRRGLVWRVGCIGGGAPLGESPMVLGTAFTWKEFDITFTVPKEKCRAQRLQLRLDARSASEQLVSGALWYDDLQISRVAAAGKVSPPAPAGTGTQLR